ncbi:sn-glycerol-3-phosphate ABC transporter permease UgpA [Roseomonas gilardii]|uniref:sn-glycerol-3-phosphate transport system permease protein UgpA n=1 Tax=Roseomonas gilardii TaxID=257708 RepID=A0A1L7AEQ2_9PROT|nr:sn-glycerol-3-phosphate ABC transporter permease UgpA [Roseomonas gilardii]APT57139.1 glycerol-3-phosphate transporter permease [Roseomonas gilardii]MDT8333382.1 sn-glycerol-3-phosphate ABC transporter permease UgpA [Roseomonas gilardii]PZR16356.1 MAG: sn-glycerol-3-phosphate ABC transporter permease UgpA [Azospirillum brasilense]
MSEKVAFRGTALPLLLLLPQLAITAIFFYWPALQAVIQSTLREDAFGLSSEFVGLENFRDVLSDPNWLHAAWNTAIFSSSVAILALSVALFLAVQADKKLRAASIYRTLLIWPYAVAPAVAAVLWLFLFHPQIGLIGRALNNAGLAWDYRLNGTQAMVLVVIASAWKQVAYNFIFFLAGLQSIPQSVLEAAAIDGARPVRRFWTVVFPLLSPTIFFLVVVNLTYAFFETFGVIHALTQGGPARATETLIYKAWMDGVQNLNLGTSSAQSVILMVMVVGLTAFQFRFIDRKVHY